MRAILFFIFVLTSNVVTAKTPFVIGIAGGSGSGKTTFAKKLQKILIPNAVIIEQDCYYKDLSHLSFEERKTINFDHPHSIDFDSFCRDIAALKQGIEVQRPNYIFSLHTRTGETTLVEPADVIIVEGILIFSDSQMRELLDLKIYVHTDDDVRILRRIERDIEERGRDFASVKNQYLTTVKPMHNQFVEPSKQYADVIIPGNADTTNAVKLIFDGLNKD
jgi:uridine kinase